jgi:hypothetical protein
VRAFECEHGSSDRRIPIRRRPNAPGFPPESALPVFDLDQTSVLVVTSFDNPGAEPILVADDGYSFVFLPG